MHQIGAGEFQALWLFPALNSELSQEFGEVHACRSGTSHRSFYAAECR